MSTRPALSPPVALAPTERRPLATYTAPDGGRRALHVLAGAGGSLLLVDRAHPSGTDPRLVAHLWPDEPLANLRLVARLYLADASARWCRPLAVEDLRAVPCETGGAPDGPVTGPDGADQHEYPELTDARGHRFRLSVVPDARGPRQLRWTCSTLGLCPGQVVSLRTEVGALEAYEPACSWTLAQLCGWDRAGGASRAILRCELRRLGASRIVLNRRLRDAVVAMMATQGLSMSELAMRCGRVKRDARGHVYGETSWLGRRIGLLPERGSQRPTPWVHSEVLALIARRGLGVSPREVEL